MRTDPRDPAIRADYALALANSGRSGEAIAQLAEAARNWQPGGSGDPRPTWECCSPVPAGATRAGGAVAAFQQAVGRLQLFGNAGSASQPGGGSLIRLRRVPEAVAEFQTALALDPGNPEIRADLERARALSLLSCAGGGQRTSIGPRLPPPGRRYFPSPLPR